MTLIDGTTAPLLQCLPDSSDVLVPGVLATLDAEFFVEWQVADDPFVAAPAKGPGEVSSL